MRRLGWYAVCAICVIYSMWSAYVEASQVRRYWHYRRYGRYRNPSSSTWQNWRVNLPVGQVRLVSIQLGKTKIDQEKLRLSIGHKLVPLSRCYRTVMREKMLSMPSVKQASPPVASIKKQKEHRKGLLQQKGPQQTHQVWVTVLLNPYGRAISTKIESPQSPRELIDCFVWQLRGRKFFPPQGDKPSPIRLHFVAEPSDPKTPVSPKTPAAIRKQSRKRRPLR